MSRHRRQVPWYPLVVALTTLGAAWTPSARVAAQEESKAQQIEFFESKVRPLFAEHCFKCHSSESKSVKGNLKLDSREGVLEGGDSGPAIVLEKPDESLLIGAVRWQLLEMPPTGKLKKREVAALVKWVEMGAPWPKATGPSSRPDPTQNGRWERLRNEHWAWQPIGRADPPEVQNVEWPLNPLDRFVLAKLESAGLPPARAAQSSRGSRAA